VAQKLKIAPHLERNFWIAFAATIVLGIIVVVLDAYLQGLL